GKKREPHRISLGNRTEAGPAGNRKARCRPRVVAASAVGGPRDEHRCRRVVRELEYYRGGRDGFSGTSCDAGPDDCGLTTVTSLGHFGLKSFSGSFVFVLMLR